MKKIVILQTSGNDLANQLWNYISVYAYAKEKNFLLENPAFFEYGNYFTMREENPIFRFFFFNPFTDYTKRKTAFRRKIWRKLFFWYVRISFYFLEKSFFSYKNSENKPYYLPPTETSFGQLQELETKNENIYLDSWLFRNPIGIEKYRKEIKEYFKPRKDIEILVSSLAKEWRNKYKTLIGVHIRQGDYCEWRGGIYFINPNRVREIIDEYLSIFKKNKDEILFIITSDGSVDGKIFEGLHFTVSKENAVTDLFLLASTDAIIGSNSTFGAFASYLGNIPLIIMQNTPISWEYYSDKTKYFENEYCTMVHY